MLKGESEEWLELFAFGVSSTQHNLIFIILFIYQEQRLMWTILCPKKCWNSKFSKWQRGDRFQLSWNKQLRPSTKHAIQYVCWGHYGKTGFSPFPCGGQLGNIKCMWSWRIHSEPKLIIHALCQQRRSHRMTDEVRNLWRSLFLH